MRRRQVVAGCATVAVLATVVGVAAGYQLLRDAEAQPSAGASAPATPDPASAGGRRYPMPAGSIVVAPTGDDGAAGTVGAPLRTAAAAVTRAPAGGTVVLRAGTYREDLGVLHKKVTLQPYAGEKVAVKGSVVVSGWKRDGAGWRHDDWAPDLCRNCYLPSILDPAHPLAGQPDMVFVDGTALRQVADARQLKPGTFRVDPAARTLWIGTDPGGRQVEASTMRRMIQFGKDADGSVLQGLTVAQYASNQQYGENGAMITVNAPKVVLRDDVIVDSASSGVQVWQPDVVVENSVLSRNGLVGLVTNRAHRLRLVGNTVTDNNAERFSLTGDAVGAAGIKVARSADVYVADNVFRDNHGNGWWCDLGCSNATVVRNLAEGNEVAGIYYEVSSGALIASNVLRDNGKRGLKISSSDRVRVWSNTFVGNPVALGVYGDPRPVSFDKYAESLGQPWRPVDLEVVDNLFASGDASDSPYIATEDQPPYRTTAPQMLRRLDGNVYVRGDDGKPQVLVSWWNGPDDTSELRTVTDIVALTGREAHGVEAAGSAESLFVAPQDGDYTLQAGSPGHRAALPLPADVAEAIGVRTGTAPDAGALSGPRR